MPINHIVLLRLGNVPVQTQETLLKHLQALKQTCLSATGEPYIIQTHVGANTSTEGLSNGYTHVYTALFATAADVEWYVEQDGAHQQAKNMIRDVLGLVGSEGGILVFDHVV